MNGAGGGAPAPRGTGPGGTGSVVLIGPPGAGCTTVGRALADLWGVPVSDLAGTVARALGTRPELALVAVPEARYRSVEAATALDLLAAAARRRHVVALGSGALADERVRRTLGAVGESGGRVIALTASTRRLASRNGLDAPRSMALGNVHHEFVQMLHAREAACRELASMRVDTTDISPRQAAAAITASSPGR